jgi:hypothetical protein
LPNQFAGLKERDDHSLSVSTLGSATLVEEARARVATMRAINAETSSVCEFSYMTPDSIVASQHNTMARASASYASYKLKLEQEERRRTEEAEKVRRVLEHDRLAIDARQEEQRQEVEAAQSQIDHNNLSARDRIVVKVQTADESVSQKTVQLHSDDEAERHSQKLPHATDKIRLREESRLRAEEKARARFASFRNAKPLIVQPPVSAATTKEELNSAAAVEEARILLSSVTAQLSEERVMHRTSSIAMSTHVVTSSSSSKMVTSSSSSHLASSSVSNGEASSDLTIDPELSYSLDSITDGL